MLATDSQPRHVAGQFVQAKGKTDPLLARHAAVAFELKVQSGLRCHCMAI